MFSIKTLKLNENDTVLFKFNDKTITIKFLINNTENELVRHHHEFNDSLNDLKSELSITNFQIKKIRYWFHKNYKKIYPIQEYTTKYGRTTTINYS
jgi:hypothetical protein